MRNLENFGIEELPKNEIIAFNGGGGLPSSAMDENYNQLAFLFGPVYDAGYVLGKYF